jgi:hypothetical protein
MAPPRYQGIVSSQYVRVPLYERRGGHKPTTMGRHLHVDLEMRAEAYHDVGRCMTLKAKSGPRPCT